MGTISYAEYRREMAKLDADSQTERGARGATEDYESLSWFDVPVAVDVDLSPQYDRCIFRFVYSDAEAPEDGPREVPSNPSVLIRLGKHSRKILEIHLLSAREALKGNGPIFDPDLVLTWVPTLPPRVGKVLERNARVIAGILEEMPSALRARLIRELEKSK